MTEKKYQRLDEASLNFIEIAKSLGYKIDRKRSSKAITIMLSDTKKIAVYDNAARGHFYLNQKDSSEKGSIIDLVKRELNCDFIRAKDFITGAQVAPLSPRTQEHKEAEKGKKDFTSAFNKSIHPCFDTYLEEERKLPIGVMEMSKDTRRGTDTNLFFHRDIDGEITGYEYRSENKKGFSKGGKKALFTIKLSEIIETIVIVESAINALSYVCLLALKEDLEPRFANTLIVSTAGRFSKSQKDQIEELAKVHSNALVILAQDNDKSGDGDKQAQELKEALINHRTIRHKPKLNDFNDDLKAIVEE